MLIVHDVLKQHRVTLAFIRSLSHFGFACQVDRIPSLWYADLNLPLNQQVWTPAVLLNNKKLIKSFQLFYIYFSLLTQVIYFPVWHNRRGQEHSSCWWRECTGSSWQLFRTPDVYQHRRTWHRWIHSFHLRQDSWFLEAKQLGNQVRLLFTY